MEAKHVPVLLHECIEGLSIKENGIYVDLTLGRGGHAEEILKRLNHGKLIGFDQDKQAIDETSARLKKYGKNFICVHDNFKNMKEDLIKLSISGVDGILMDLGVSSPQFDEMERGFSYRGDALLDMRMDTRNSLSAYEVVNTYGLVELTNVFRNYGEDKYAYQVAKMILRQREVKPIQTTSELVEIIKSAKPKKELAKKGHPAKQIFQALRIEVNDELGALDSAIKDALEILNSGGRLAVISFQSLEDRIVKETFRSKTVIEGTRKNVFTLPIDEKKPLFKLVSKGVIEPSKKELEENPRSHSAKLRIIEKL